MGRRQAFSTSSSSALSSPLLLFLLSLASAFFVSSSEQPPLRDVNLQNPTIHFSPSSFDGNSCDRIRVSGISRLTLGSYATAIRVSMNTSESTHERIHRKIDVCFHRNSSMDPCQCEMDEWQALQKGQWNAIISPYETRYLDVKVRDKTSSSFTLSIQEEFQQWRLFCLGIGIMLLLLAPIMSNWAPFYYSSSMALGVLLVVLIILYQGMKLLPMGRKNIFYITIYGSVLGVGSYIARYFSTLVSSVLLNFGLSEDMHNPVSVFLLVGVILTGAALGCWMVRKFIVSEDGRIDVGIAQFVRWAMRAIAMIFVLQSTLDALLALVTLGVCWSVTSLITRKLLSPATLKHRPMNNKGLWRQKALQVSPNNRQAEFLSRSARKDYRGTVWGNSPTLYGRSNLSKKGQAFLSPYTSPYKKMGNQDQDYYSTFHKTPTRKFSKKEWENFTHESTREALVQCASTPEFAHWLADNAHRLHVDQQNSSDENTESPSGSSEETQVETGSGHNQSWWY